MYSVTNGYFTHRMSTEVMRVALVDDAIDRLDLEIQQAQQYAQSSMILMADYGHTVYIGHNLTASYTKEE